jgi:hypothetical protein
MVWNGVERGYVEYGSSYYSLLSSTLLYIDRLLLLYDFKKSRSLSSTLEVRQLGKLSEMVFRLMGFSLTASCIGKIEWKSDFETRIWFVAKMGL